MRTSFSRCSVDVVVTVEFAAVRDCARWCRIKATTTAVYMCNRKKAKDSGGAEGSPGQQTTPLLKCWPILPGTRVKEHEEAELSRHTHTHTHTLAHAPALESIHTSGVPVRMLVPLQLDEAKNKARAEDSHLLPSPCSKVCKEFGGSSKVGLVATQKIYFTYPCSARYCCCTYTRASRQNKRRPSDRGRAQVPISTL